MKIADLVRPSMTVTVHVRDDLDVPVEVVPDRLTPVELARLADLQAATEEAGASGEAMAQLTAIVAELVVSWDLEDDAGPLPITAEAIMGLPVSFVSALIGAVMEAAVVPPTNGGASGGTSPPRGR